FVAARFDRRELGLLRANLRATFLVRGDERLDVLSRILRLLRARHRFGRRILIALQSLDALDALSALLLQLLERGELRAEVATARLQPAQHVLGLCTDVVRIEHAGLYL